MMWMKFDSEFFVPGLKIICAFTRYERNSLLAAPSYLVFVDLAFRDDKRANSDRSMRLVIDATIDAKKGLGLIPCLAKKKYAERARQWCLTTTTYEREYDEEEDIDILSLLRKLSSKHFQGRKRSLPGFLKPTRVLPLDASPGSPRS
jgi:hypothetical protein